MTRHILGLYQGLPGARRWRQHISENVHRKGAGLKLLTRRFDNRPAHHIAKRTRLPRQSLPK